VQTVSVHTPVTGAVHDVPVTDGGEPPEPLPDDHDEPVVLDLIASRESTEDGSSRSETSEEVSVALSTDVLFDVDESELRLDAEAELKEVAEEIESSGATKVKIDGHTDDTGTDEINEPLSEDRAAAVEKRLKELAGEDGIEYTSQGHGSEEPVAENDTEENRQKNRRVTVGFDTPEGGASEPGPSAAPSAPADEPAEEGGYGTADIAEGEESEYLHSLQVRVDSVDRSSAGGLTTLRYTVLNSANEESAILAGDLGNVSVCGGVGDGRLNGSVLTDDAASLSYPVVRYPSEDCLAPRGNGVTVMPNEGLTLWQAFWLDPATTEVTVHVPRFDPVKGVPVI